MDKVAYSIYCTISILPEEGRMIGGVSMEDGLSPYQLTFMLAQSSMHLFNPRLIVSPVVSFA